MTVKLCLRCSCRTSKQLARIQDCCLLPSSRRLPAGGSGRKQPPRFLCVFFPFSPALCLLLGVCCANSLLQASSATQRMPAGNSWHEKVSAIGAHINGSFATIWNRFDKTKFSQPCRLPGRRFMPPPQVLPGNFSCWSFCMGCVFPEIGAASCEQSSQAFVMA